MEHLPSGTQWLHSRVDINGYEEYSGVEYRSAGCSREYSVIGRDLEQAGEIESLQLEGDVGGGLTLERKIAFPENEPNFFQIDSGIVARKVGARSGGFSSSKHEVWQEGGELLFEEDLQPNGQWMLIDECLGLALVNWFGHESRIQVYCTLGNGDSESGALVRELTGVKGISTQNISWI